MKQYLLLILLGGALLSPAVRAAEVVPAKNGKAQMSIVTPAKGNVRYDEAALALQEYIEKICGVKLAINKDGKRVPGKAFYIGPCQGAPKCTLPPSGANWEGYTITERNGDVYFSGLNPIPTANAVYSFLEDDLGVRWFAPGELWELVPKSKTPGTLKVNVKSRTVVPQTSPRIWSGHGWNKDWGYWCLRNKVGSAEVVSKRNFQNMMYKILPPAKYAKTHPEYYPLMPDGKRFIPDASSPHWRPCESNPEVQKIVIAYIDNFFKKNPKVDSFSLGMDDVTRMCCCANCRAMDDAADSYEKQRFSDRHYKFVNIIAREIRKKHPDKYIGVLIYQITRKLPRQVPVMEPNVFGYITETSAFWWQPGMMQFDNDLTAQWRKRIQHLSRYDYYGQGAMTPRYYPHYVDKQLKYDKSLGMEGMYIETYAFLPLSAPMIYLVSKLQWDASLDADKVLDDFMNIYGTAKPQMAQFWDLLEKSFQQPRAGRVGGENRNLIVQSLAISPEDMDKAFALLAEAEKAANGDAKVLARVDVHKAALKLSSYAVKPYAINLQIRDIKVNSREAADKVFELIKKLEEAKVGRDEFIESLRKRNDLLGQNIAGFETKTKGYLRVGSFAELENDSIMALFHAFDWYGKNAPDELEKRAAATNSTAIKEYAAEYMRNLRQGRKAKNLIKNGGFEIRNTALEQKQKGCPQDWTWWTRGGRPLKFEIVPDGHTGNALKLSDCSAQLGNLIQIVDIEEGATYLLSCYMKTHGTARGGLGIRFRDKRGVYCKVQTEEVKIMAQPSVNGEWRLVALLIHVPKGIGAKRISIHPQFLGLNGESYLLLDDFQIFKIKEDKKGKDKMKGLYLNEDCNNFLVSFPESYMTREGLEKFIRGYMHKQVGAVVLNPNAQRAFYNSQVIDPIWKDVEIAADDEIIFNGQLQKLKPYHVNQIRYCKKMHDNGLNPYVIWLEVLRKNGFEGWISCRMNDVHNALDENSFMHDKFWRKHPEYRCSPYDGTWAGYCLDYKYPAVREYRLKLIEEMLNMYDCDGLELDWLRFPRCLQPGYELENAHYVTELMRQIRNMVDKKARERKHPIKINVRVPSRPDDARRSGYDVITWVREGLVDAVTVSNFWPATDSDMPLEIWRELLGKDIELNAGLDLFACAYHNAPMIPSTLEMAAGFACEYLYRGADHIYLFNFMHGRTGMRDDEKFAVLMDNCGKKETAYALPRRHIITYPSSRPAGTVPDCALPRVIKPNWQPFRINVGGGTANRTAYVVTGVEKPLEGNQKIRVKFHGVDCPEAEPLKDFKFPGQVADTAYHKIPEGLLHDGDNVFHVHLTEGENRAVWCEIAIP